MCNGLRTNVQIWNSISSPEDTSPPSKVPKKAIVVNLWKNVISPPMSVTTYSYENFGLDKNFVKDWNDCNKVNKDNVIALYAGKENQEVALIDKLNNQGIPAELKCSWKLIKSKEYISDPDEGKIKSFGYYDIISLPRKLTITTPDKPGKYQLEITLESTEYAQMTVLDIEGKFLIRQNSTVKIKFNRIVYVAKIISDNNQNTDRTNDLIEFHKKAVNYRRYIDDLGNKTPDVMHAVLYTGEYCLPFRSKNEGYTSAGISQGQWGTYSHYGSTNPGGIDIGMGLSRNKAYEVVLFSMMRGVVVKYDNVSTTKKMIIDSQIPGVGTLRIEYWHIKEEDNPSRWYRGLQVEMGTPIGIVSNTGSIDIHLHLQIALNNISTDPLKFFDLDKRFALDAPYGAGSQGSYKFDKLEADGEDSKITTERLTLEFKNNENLQAGIYGLKAEDFKVTGATRGTLSKIDNDWKKYTLSISNITVANGEKVTVEVTAPPGITIGSSKKEVVVYKA